MANDDQVIYLWSSAIMSVWYRLNDIPIAAGDFLNIFVEKEKLISSSNC